MCVRLRVLKSNAADFVNCVGLHKSTSDRWKMHSEYNRQPKYFNSLEMVYESELIDICDYFRHLVCTLLLVTANPK